MTVKELQDMVSEQLGQLVSGLRTLEGHTSGTTRPFFDQDEVSYTGLATTLEGCQEVQWIFKKFEDDWYFSCDSL